MRTKSKEGRYASQAPGWNINDGCYHIRELRDEDTGEVRRVLEWEPPNIERILEPLLGGSVTKRGRTRATYRKLADCRAIYAQAIDILTKWCRRDHLFKIAFYRRQLTGRKNIAHPLVNIREDAIFLAVALDMDPPLSMREWNDLARRMPFGSRIRQACESRGTPPAVPALAIAAE